MVQDAPILDRENERDKLEDRNFLHSICKTPRYSVSEDPIEQPAWKHPDYRIESWQSVIFQNIVCQNMKSSLPDLAGHLSWIGFWAFHYVIWVLQFTHWLIPTCSKLIGTFLWIFFYMHAQTISKTRKFFSFMFVYLIHDCIYILEILWSKTQSWVYLTWLGWTSCKAGFLGALQKYGYLDPYTDLIHNMR